MLIAPRKPLRSNMWTSIWPNNLAPHWHIKLTVLLVCKYIFSSWMPRDSPGSIGLCQLLVAGNQRGREAWGRGGQSPLSGWFSRTASPTPKMSLWRQLQISGLLSLPGGRGRWQNYVKSHKGKKLNMIYTHWSPLMSTGSMNVCWGTDHFHEREVASAPPQPIPRSKASAGLMSTTTGPFGLF